MRSKRFLGVSAVVVMLSFLFFGCDKNVSKTTETAKPAAAAAQQKSANVYKGPIVGKSNKAKTISITVGKGDAAKTMMVRFDDKTIGIEHAKKGEAAIINWQQRGDDKFATVIKPKLAKLPEGVTEIQVEELHQLLSDKVSLTLVDARPESRFDQAHLPGSISIPVPKLKKMKAEVLPKDKDKLLIFYCGGYT
jgi:hypothetical protein